jgi:hypothetical protein
MKWICHQILFWFSGNNRKLCQKLNVKDKISPLAKTMGQRRETGNLCGYE